MNERCPNCGSENVGQWTETNWLCCNECGTMVNKETNASFVPRRSQPAKIKELPDSNGPWWHRFESTKAWFVSYIRLTENGPKSVYGTSGICSPGVYVKAEPPIVPPQNEDEDEDEDDDEDDGFHRRISEDLYLANIATEWQYAASRLSRAIGAIADRLERMEEKHDL